MYIGATKRLCPDRLEGFLNPRKVPYREPVYLGEKRIMTQCTFVDRLAHGIKVLLKQD